MCVCRYIHTHIFLCVCVCVHVYACIHTHVHMRIKVSLYICVCVCICVYVYTCMHIYVWYVYVCSLRGKGIEEQIDSKMAPTKKRSRNVCLPSCYRYWILHLGHKYGSKDKISLRKCLVSFQVHENSSKSLVKDWLPFLVLEDGIILHSWFDLRHFSR